MDESTQFIAYNVVGDFQKITEATPLPYTLYNEANVAEDKVLFPDELVSNKQKVPFREIRNGINRIEKGMLPSSVRHMKKALEALAMGEDPEAAVRIAKEDKQNNLWTLPKLWESGLTQLRQERHSAKQRKLLERTGLDEIEDLSYAERLVSENPMETMERDRSFGEQDLIIETPIIPNAVMLTYPCSIQRFIACRRS